MLRKIDARIKVWKYWKKKYPTYDSWYNFKVLLGIEQPFSFRVMAPLRMFIDKMDKIGKEIDHANVEQRCSKKI